MGTIKDRNNKDLIETKEIKKRWQGRRIVQKKVLMYQITTMVWSLTESQVSSNMKSSGP